jgi:DNA-directed RNA polymerase III subunit RPC4
LADAEIASHTRTFARPWAPSRRGRTGSAQKFGKSARKDGNGHAGSEQQGSKDQEEPEDNEDATQSSDEDEEDQGRRVDVNYINLISSEDEDPILPNSHLFAPVRINRVEHVNKAMQVNSDGSGIQVKKQEDEDEVHLNDIPTSKRKATKPRARDVEVLGTERRWRGVYQDDDDIIMIKDEPTEQTSAAITASESKSQKESQSDRRARIKAKRKKRFSKEPFVLQTDEDREEWKRWRDDRQIMVDELGGRVGQLQAARENDQMDVDLPANYIPDPKENHPFLLHLPPVLADLIDPTKAPTNISKSPSKPNAQPTNTDSADPIPSSSTATNDHGEEVITIKDDLEPKKPEVFPPRPSHLPKLESGFVGKLRVYKSGKTELDWGGVNLEMKKGITPQFLQDIVMVRVKQPSEEPGVSQPRPLEGEALSFGQVRGKFIVTPDFDEIFS